MVVVTGEVETRGGGKMAYRIRRVAVLGAGTMGAAIAAHCANSGLEVDLLDIAPEGDDDNDAVVKAGFDRMRKARPPALMADEVANRIRIGNFEDDFDRVAEADWVLEAIIEKLEPKQELMQRVESIAKESAIISSNTSGIPLHQVAEGRSDEFRRRFLGTHFFNPPRYLKLLEIIPTGRASRVRAELRGARPGEGGCDREGHAELHREPPRELRRDAVGEVRL
jgi:3-hydroxyacyl-CoA dehydrogenase